MNITAPQAAVDNLTHIPNLQSSNNQKFYTKNYQAANDTHIPDSDKNNSNDFSGLINLVGALTLLLNTATAIDRSMAHNSFHPDLLGMHASGLYNPIHRVGNFMEALSQLGQGIGLNRATLTRPPKAMTISERLASAQNNLSQQELAADEELESLASLRGKSVGDSSSNDPEKRFDQIQDRLALAAREIKTLKINALTTGDNAAIKELDHRQRILDRSKLAYEEIYSSDPTNKGLDKAESQVARIKELMLRQRQIAEMQSNQTGASKEPRFFNRLRSNNSKKTSNPEALRQAMLIVNDELRSLAGHTG